MQSRVERRVVRATESGWDGVPVEGYRPGAAVGVSRHTILGSRKDNPGDPGPSKELRYFELAPGAVSRLEKHEHEHVVIVKCGLGYAIIDNTLTEIAPNDVVYVAPLELHQFLNRGDEPFGFYCFVDAARDFSQEPAPDELERLMASPAGKVARPYAVPPPAKRS
ncbi:MAG TPA: cupin domain-containing protein [Candidatus Baltobacteraceae bacterium]|jgi:mannose-6-phosphate isomerase-like protein (cupin superfamily)|nr:cupin domain-containing protein [Candidatus Baltobacteraceae bacterium]